MYCVGDSSGTLRRIPIRRPLRPNASSVQRSSSIPGSTSSGMGVGMCARTLRLFLTGLCPTARICPGESGTIAQQSLLLQTTNPIRMYSTGIHLADATMWLVCVSVLATFEVTPPVEDGKPIIPSGKFLDGSIRCETPRRNLCHEQVLIRSPVSLVHIAIPNHSSA